MTAFQTTLSSDFTEMLKKVQNVPVSLHISYEFEYIHKCGDFLDTIGSFKTAELHSKFGCPIGQPPKYKFMEETFKLLGQMTSLIN